jgi:hypothetical protein
MLGCVDIGRVSVNNVIIHSVMIALMDSSTKFQVFFFKFYSAEQASVVRCPFNGAAYYFTYNDLVHGSCPQALSYAKPCAGHTRYQLRFNHCVDGAAFNGRGQFQTIVCFEIIILDVVLCLRDRYL